MATVTVKPPNIASGNYLVHLVVTQQSQNIANNTSTIKYEAYLNNPKYTYWYAQLNKLSMRVTIDGTVAQTQTNMQYDFRPSGSARTQCYMSGTAVVNHNNDGTKSAVCKVELIDKAPGPGSCNAQVTLNLSTIARASEITSFSNLTITTAATSINFTLDRKDSSFTHTANLKIGSTTIETWNSFGVVTSRSLNTTAVGKMLAAMPNSTSTTMTLNVTTMKGTTTIGTKSKTATVTISTSIIPSISNVSVTASTPKGAISSLTRSYAVKGEGTIKVSFTPTAGAGSSVKSRKIEIGSHSKSNVNTYTVTPTSSGLHAIKITVTDNRNRTATHTASSQTVIDYSPLTAQLTYIQRPTSGTLTRLQAAFKLTVSPITYSSATTNGYKVTIKATPVGGGTTITSVNETTNPGSASNATKSYAPTNTHDGTTAYAVTITVKDDYSSATINGTLSTASYPLVLGDVGIGVGKVPEGLAALEVEGGIVADLIKLGGNPIVGFKQHLGSNGPDLNDIKETGMYYQSGNVNATLDKNYPVPYAGLLLVINNEFSEADDRIHQFYLGYHSGASTYNIIQYRTRYQSTWYPWLPIANDNYMTTTTTVTSFSNGWTGSLIFSKNEAGLKTMRGTLISPSSGGVTAGTVVLSSIPTGYQPSEMFALIAYDGTLGYNVNFGVFSTAAITLRPFRDDGKSTTSIINSRGHRFNLTYT